MVHILFCFTVKSEEKFSRIKGESYKVINNNDYILGLCFLLGSRFSLNSAAVHRHNLHDVPLNNHLDLTIHSFTLNCHYKFTAEFYDTCYRLGGTRLGY